MSSKPDNEQNLKSESIGINYLIDFDTHLIIPTLEQKKRLLSLINISNLYSRSFDLVKLKVESFEKIQTKADFQLIEVKVTRKYLENFPKGFFFGMTQNEDQLLKELEGVFVICLISINEVKSSHTYLTHSELHALIRHKRIQYQINL